MIYKDLKYYLASHTHGFRFSSVRKEAEVFKSKKEAELFMDNFDNDFVCLGWTILPIVYFEKAKK